MKIRQKLPGEVDEEQQQEDKNKKPLSVSSQAFNLFLKGQVHCPGCHWA
jgi:beta-galactosidase beta subunit